MKNLELIKTCSACPEQYSVLNENNNEIGYIRFRFGQLEVHPVVNSEVLWNVHLLSKSVNDDWLGIIPDDLQEPWLNEATEKIIQYYEDNKRES